MRKNFFKALGFAVLMLVFPVVSSVIIQVAHISDNGAIFRIQALAFGFAGVSGLLIMRAMKRHDHHVEKMSWKSVLWFVPLVVIEGLGLVLGFQTDLTIPYVLSLLAFTLAVGIGEEVFFRGIILRLLQSINAKYAIIVSSILFGLLHLANLAGGVSVEYAILQVIFAFLFGFIAANIVILRHSLFPVIVWHFSHDFIALLSGDVLNQCARIVLCMQLVIMVGYAGYLWIQVGKAKR